MKDENPVISGGDMETYCLRGPAEIGTNVGDARIQPLDAEPGAFISGVDLRTNRAERVRAMRVATLKLLRTRLVK